MWCQKSNTAATRQEEISGVISTYKGPVRPHTVAILECPQSSWLYALRAQCLCSRDPGPRLGAPGPSEVLS
jgi:hypothetical protein